MAIHRVMYAPKATLQVQLEALKKQGMEVLKVEEIPMYKKYKIEYTQGSRRSPILE